MSSLKNGSAILAVIFLSLVWLSNPALAQTTTAAYLSPVYPSSTSLAVASYLRVTNTSVSDGEVEVIFRNGGSSQVLGAWIGEVPAGASVQFDVDDMEALIGISASQAGDFYSLAVSANFTGFVQHALWNAVGGSLTNLSSCSSAISDTGQHLGNVHTSRVTGYPSTIIIQNTGDTADTASFDVFDSRTGELVEENFSRVVPANSSVTFTVGEFAQAFNFSPTDGQFHLDFVLDAGFTGFAQHLVVNEGAGVLTDMTAKCALPVSEIQSASALGAPTLPANLFNYENPNLPAHFTQNNASFGSVAQTDNTPNNNPVTDEGATLGRVLFYDKRLSANDTVACASCHLQENGFSDPRQFSVGFEGGLTGRHSMALANATYYERGRFFWDERAATLEDQVLLPIQDSVEMGMDLNTLEDKLEDTTFYAGLFQDAFGSTEITSERISLALAQFVRSMVSFQSPFDDAFNNNGQFTGNGLTQEEQLGRQLFFSNNNGPNCDACHETSAMSLDQPRNNGLDANTNADQGAGGGQFKSPSLRNIAVRAPYMHDGRFNTLEEVIEHYNSGIQDHPQLANQLRQNGQPERLNLTQEEKDALVAFLETLTDQVFLTDPKFSDPFDD